MTTFESVFLWCECMVCLAGIILAIKFRRDIVLKAADIASVAFWMLVMFIGVALLFEFLSHRASVLHVVCAALLIGVAWLLKPRRAQRSKTSV